MTLGAENIQPQRDLIEHATASQEKFFGRYIFADDSVARGYSADALSITGQCVTNCFGLMEGARSITRGISAVASLADYAAMGPMKYATPVMRASSDWVPR